MLFIPLFCQTEMQIQTHNFCLKGTINIPLKVLEEPKEQDQQLVIIFCQSTPILSKEDTMLSTGNKVQIIDIISKYLIELLNNTNNPVQAENGVVSKRTDLESLHQEADIIIIKKCTACVKDEVKCVKVICGDTDVFVLLTVYVFRQGCKLKVLMEAFDASRSLTDINETAQKHAEIVQSLIDAHAISCHDSVSMLHGIGMQIVIKHLKDQHL